VSQDGEVIITIARIPVGLHVNQLICPNPNADHSIVYWLVR